MKKILAGAALILGSLSFANTISTGSDKLPWYVGEVIIMFSLLWTICIVWVVPTIAIRFARTDGKDYK